MTPSGSSHCLRSGCAHPVTRLDQAVPASGPDRPGHRSAPGPPPQRPPRVHAHPAPARGRRSGAPPGRRPRGRRPGTTTRPDRPAARPPRTPPGGRDVPCRAAGSRSSMSISSSSPRPGRQRPAAPGASRRAPASRPRPRAHAAPAAAAALTPAARAAATAAARSGDLISSSRCIARLSRARPPWSGLPIGIVPPQRLQAFTAGSSPPARAHYFFGDQFRILRRRVEHLAPRPHAGQPPHQVVSGGKSAFAVRRHHHGIGVMRRIWCLSPTCGRWRSVNVRAVGGCRAGPYG